MCGKPLSSLTRCVFSQLHEHGSTDSYAVP